MKVRDGVNRLLRNYGYELAKFDRFSEALERLADEVGQLRFIQVGANDGVKFDQLYDFVTQRNCAGIVIEPLRCYFDKLRENYAAHPEITPLNVAVHRELKQVPIYHVDPRFLDRLPEWAQGIGSFDRAHLERFDLPPEAILAETVECCSLMEIIRAYQFEELHLLQIDVEGYDAEVVRMIDFSTVRPRLIKYEAQNLGQFEQRGLKQLLRRLGYRVFRQKNDTIAIDATC